MMGKEVKIEPIKIISLTTSKGRTILAKEGSKTITPKELQAKGQEVWASLITQDPIIVKETKVTEMLK